MTGDRPLSEAGRRDAEAMALLLKKLEVSAPVIWHSGKARARQTAEIFQATNLAAEGLLLREGLLPMDPVKPVAKLLGRYEPDLMIVGHEPFLGELAAKLVTGKRRRPVLELGKGAVACLARNVAGDWRIGWVATPAMAHRCVQASGEGATASARDWRSKDK